jgi:hypothetical protein
VISKEEEITAFVNNKNVDNKEQQGKMNIIRNQKRVLHTIVNIPTKDGVHFGVCIIFLSYYFESGFENDSYDHKNEEGKEVLNIREYYY